MGVATSSSVWSSSVWWSSTRARSVAERELVWFGGLGVVAGELGCGELAGAAQRGGAVGQASEGGMLYEFRWYCQQVSAVVAVQVSALDEREAGTLAALVLHDLATPSRRKYEWRPGAVVTRELAR